MTVIQLANGNETVEPSLHSKLCELTAWLHEHGIKADVRITFHQGPYTLRAFVGMNLSNMGASGRPPYRPYIKTPHGRVHVRDRKPKKP